MMDGNLLTQKNSNAIDAHRRISEYGPNNAWHFQFALAAIVVGCFLLRLPPLLHQPGKLDEDCYAIPGLTILTTGIPQMPHLPTRDLKSAFYSADVILYCEPPLYFYVQALFYAVLPVTYGSARLISLLASCVVLVLAAKLVVHWTGSVAAGLWTAGLLGLSRWFYWTALMARPDMLCALLGLAALASAYQWVLTRKTRWLIGTGVFLGLGGLTLPLAIVIAAQLAAWIFLESRGWERLFAPFLIAIMALAVFSVWGFLIALHPEIFRVQFTNQFLASRRDEMPLHWLMNPIYSLWFHAQYLWTNVGPVQCLLPMISTTLCFTLGIIRRQANLIRMACLTCSSFVLLSLFVGGHHIVPGYWVYTGTLAFISVGWSIAECAKLFRLRWSTIRKPLVIAGSLLVIAAMLPGSGLRLFVEYTRHWYDSDYHAPSFAKRLIASIPPDSKCMVDGEFILDFLVAGRPALEAPLDPPYFDDFDRNYDVLFVSRRGMEAKTAQRLSGQLERSEGIAGDEFACYCEIYSQSDSR